MKTTVMEAMMRFGFLLGIIGVGAIFKRSTQEKQKKKIKRGDVPEGMCVMFENSFGLPILYALTVVMFVIVMFFVGLAYSMEGSNVMNVYTFVIIGIAIGMVIIMAVFKHFYDKRKIMWDEQKIIIDYASGKRRVVSWYEVAKVEEQTEAGWIKGPGLAVYDRTGEKLFFATPTMVNYEYFYQTMKKLRGSNLWNNL